jgi:hypothetical protein
VTTARKRRPFVRDKNTALLGAAACLIAGSFLLYDAYEGRGGVRPWPVHFLPGV